MPEVSLHNENRGVSPEQEASFGVAQKKPALYLVMVGLWLLLLVSALPNLWHTFTDLDSILAKLLFVPFVGCLVLFWFYGIYHLVFLIFAYLRKPVLAARTWALAKDMPTLKAAIIYTTFNDFNRGAALTCLNQDYPDYHVFILDVSTNADMKKQVDAFHEEFASAATLIRLQPRQGFKARSLNDALKTVIGDDYQLFAVCDADNYWPSDFLSRTIPYFSLDERIAFVQAKAAISGRSQIKFAHDFEVAIDASWTLHQLPRDKYGLLMCMGHSVVVRREAWKRVGGYPEIVQEDTAFTMRLREHSYYGLFVPEVVCTEEFPEDFRRWRRRQFRLVQADTEILFTQMPRFLKNKSISFIEKLDLLARTIRIPSQSLTLPFLLLFLLIPLANEGILSAISLDSAYGAMLSPVVVSATLLMAVAPLYPFVVYLRKQPLRLVALLFRSITLHYSLMALSVISLLVYVFSGRAMFVVTGTKDGAAVQSQSTGRLSGFLKRLNADSPLVIIMEIVLGLVLGYVGIACSSLVVVGVALVLIMSPMMRRFGWQNRAISVAVYLPLILIVAGLVISLLDVTTVQSQYLVLAVLAVLLF